MLITDTKTYAYIAVSASFWLRFIFGSNKNDLRIKLNWNGTGMEGGAHVREIALGNGKAI